MSALQSMLAERAEETLDHVLRMERLALRVCEVNAVKFPTERVCARLAAVRRNVVRFETILIDMEVRS